MRFVILGLCGALVATLAGCGEKKQPVSPSGPGSTEQGEAPKVNDQVARGYKSALEYFIEHDRKNDWSPEVCNTASKMFIEANEAQKSSGGKELAEAVYNAGLSQQRCNADAEAKKYFQQALSLDANSHRAKTQLALYAYKEGGDAMLQKTIDELQQAVLDAKFQNTEALVHLASLQMKRGSSAAGQNCANDFECAKGNLQRALAVDDAYMPAFNQLALYYLERAKEKVGRKKGSGISVAKTARAKKEKKIDQQQLELAALVCSQAIRKNPKYAAIHNTAGLIQVELGNINTAVAEFKTASDLDPTFFEALMNYAAVNLSFRGFSNSEKAYRQALQVRPNDFDAHLGLALAIRGQINDSNWDTQVKAAQELLDKAKQLQPERAETYYNEGILTQEFKVKGETDPKKQIPILKQANDIYNQFIAKAGSKEEMADAVKRAKERIRDIDDTIKFVESGIKAAEEMPPPADQPAGLEGGDSGESGEKKEEPKKDDAPKPLRRF